MSVTIKVFHTPKAGCTEDEYEDAYWVPQEADPSTLGLRMAVADGATETSFARLWARLLVRAYGRRRLNHSTFTEQIGRIQRIWKRCTHQKELTWYAEEKARMGAFSSLLGLEICYTADEQGGKWESLSAGDSCLFQVRGEDKVIAFPLTQSLEFTSRPLLLSSVSRAYCDHSNLVEYTSGKWQLGDLFLLMTDAIACWFLKRWELHSDPLYLLRHVRDQQDFHQFVVQQRQDCNDGVPLMKNDDVTLISARL